MTTVAAHRPRLIVPPGWAWIPVKADNRQTAEETFRAAWRSGPRDSIGPFVHRLEDWLVDVLDEAHRAQAFAVVLPLGVPWQVPISTALSLSVAPATHAELPERGELIDTDAGPARRTIVDVSVDDADPEDLELLRTIEYVWATPEQDAFLVAFASISGQPVAEFAPVTDALTLLIQTMLDALDWSGQEDESA